MNKINFIESESGIIIFENSKFIPDFDVDKASNLAIKILNLENIKTKKKLKNNYIFEGLNFASSIISDLTWKQCYNYTKFNEYIYKQKKNKLFITNKNINSDLYFILNHIYGEKFFQYSLKTKIKIKIKKNIIEKLPILYNFYLSLKEGGFFFFLNNLKKKEVIVDTMSKDNFRMKEIIDILEKDNFNILKTPGEFQKEFFYKKKTSEINYNLEEFKDDEILYNFVKNTILRIEFLIEDIKQRYIHYVNKLINSKIKYLFSMDELNYHIFPLLFACKKLDIKTIGYQHAATYNINNFPYRQNKLDNFNFDWFDTIIVNGEYWLEKLKKNNNLNNLEIIIGSNKNKLNFNKRLLTKNIKNKYNKNTPINILAPYEFLANTYENGKFINKFIENGHKIYFKVRPDSDAKKQIGVYFIKKELRDKIQFVYELDINILNKIDCIFGNMTTLLYEYIPLKLPILYPNTNFNLIHEIVDDKLAVKLEIHEIDNLFQLLNNFKYNGNEANYYFSEKSLKYVLKNVLNN